MTISRQRAGNESIAAASTAISSRVQAASPGSIPASSMTGNAAKSVTAEIGETRFRRTSSITTCRATLNNRAFA